MSETIDKQYRVSNQIELMRTQADDLRDKWLRENGWTHTSSTPGCVWLWRKGEFFCGANTAEHIQRTQCADAYFGAHPEQESD